MGHHHHHHHHHHHRHHHHHHRSSSSKKQFDAKSIRQQKIVGICMAVVGAIFLVLGILGAVQILPYTYLYSFTFAGFVFFVVGIINIAESFYLNKKLAKKSAVTCPDCGATNKPESTFCERCGKTLRVTCPYCGADLNDDSNKCPQCGQSVEI